MGRNLLDESEWLYGINPGAEALVLATFTIFSFPIFHQFSKASNGITDQAIRFTVLKMAPPLTLLVLRSLPVRNTELPLSRVAGLLHLPTSTLFQTFGTE